MAEKLLTETAWKSFAKGKDLDDAALLKSLAKLGKVNDDKHDDVLSALTELEGVLNKQVIANAKRKEKDVKEVKDQLHDMLSALERQRKQVNADKDAKAEADEEESPAQLTSKMLPLIRTLRKGDDRFNAVIGVAKGEAAVLISRKSVGGGQKKVVAAELGGSGVQYAVGTCFFEKGALIFAVDKSPGQLAKKVRDALIKQVELKLKVKIRTDDGGDEEHGESEEETPEQAARSQVPPAPDKDKLAFAQRLLKLRPGVEKAAAAGSPLAAQMQALVTAATAKVKEGGAVAALADLDELEKLLAEAGRTTGAGAPRGEDEGGEREDEDAGEGGVDPKVAFNARLTALMPRIQAATQAGGDAAARVKLKFGQMGVLAKKPDFPGAHTVLDEIEELLEGQPAGKGTTPQPTGPTDSPQAQAEALRAKLQDDFDALQRGPLNPSLRQQFQPIMTGWMAAQDAMEKGLHERALMVLRKIDDTGTLAKLRQALDAEPGGTGDSGGKGEGGDRGRLVRQRTFMLERWSKIPAQLRGLLGPLRKELVASGADEDPDGLVDEIESALDDLLEELQDELDDAINAGSTAGLQGVRSRFDRSELVQHLLDGPGIDSGKLLKAVLDAVDEIEAEMTR